MMITAHHNAQLVLAALLAVGLSTLPALTASAQSESDTGEPDDAILDQVEPMLTRLGEIRGLPPKGPIEAGIHSRETLREVLLEKIAQEITPEEIRAEALVLSRLGVLDPDVDYYELMLEILTSQIAGFYDEDTQQLFVLDDLPASSQAPTMAHELFHGIQDQLFGIEKIRPHWIRGTDAMLAATALIEGDATGVMIDYMMGGSLSFTDIPNFLDLLGSQLDAFDDLSVMGMPENVPDYLRDELYYPYIHGLAFVHFIKSAGGWADVDQVYEDPPLSTEQVLHPERYIDRDLPTWIELDLTPIEALGYTPIFDQVFGEFRWTAVLRDRLDESLSARAIENAAAGWDGDRFIALETAEGVLALAVLTVWDSTQDAEEFHAVLQQLISTRSGESEAELVEIGDHGALVALRTEDHWTVAERWGDMVLFLDGVPHDQSGDEAWMWREVVWSGRQRSTYPPPPQPSSP